MGGVALWWTERMEENWRAEEFDLMTTGCCDVQKTKQTHKSKNFQDLGFYLRKKSILMFEHTMNTNWEVSIYKSLWIKNTQFSFQRKSKCAKLSFHAEGLIKSLIDKWKKYAFLFKMVKCTTFFFVFFFFLTSLINKPKSITVNNNKKMKPHKARSQDCGRGNEGAA